MIQSPDEPILELNEIGVCYRRRTGIFSSQGKWAINSVSFRVEHGETLGIIGRNGAGKSTILRVIAGIIHPDKGTIKKNSDYTASLLALQIGFVPYLTGRENIYLSGMVLGMTKKALDEKLDEIIAFSELGENIDEPVSTYSVGMRARLGFSISFQADPDVLLIDEVLGVGDAAFKKKSTNAIHEKIASRKTVILVSHNEHSIQELCDRVVWIENGKTVAEGTPEEIMKEYQK